MVTSSSLHNYIIGLLFFHSFLMICFSHCNFDFRLQKIYMYFRGHKWRNCMQWSPKCFDLASCLSCSSFKFISFSFICFTMMWPSVGWVWMITFLFSSVTLSYHLSSFIACWMGLLAWRSSDYHSVGGINNFGLLLGF